MKCSKCDEEIKTDDAWLLAVSRGYEVRVHQWCLCGCLGYEEQFPFLDALRDLERPVRRPNLHVLPGRDGRE